MNVLHWFRFIRWSPALFVSFLVPLLNAQTAAESPARSTQASDSKPITLDVFAVNSSGDVGYTATSALAGGRIDTPLKYTPSAISILTAEFLEDIGATTFGSAAEWAPNAIPVGETNTTSEYNVNLRGLGNSFPTRNYFRWYVSSDSYNTERLEFSRGPNSIVFGDGNPGGISTTWTKQALFADRRSVQFRTDTFGGYRASLDYNVMVNDKLAVRVNAVNDRLKGWRDYDVPTRASGHIAATFRLAKNTQLRGEYEQGLYRRFGYAQTFADQGSSWNRVASYNGVTAPSTTGTGVARLNSGVNDNYLVYDPSQASLGIVNWQGFFQSTGTGLRMLPDTRNITNFPVLPSREFSIQPPNSYIDTRYKTWTFYLEHKFGEALAAQLAFNHQDQQRNGKLRTWDQYRIDVNTVLPNGQPNPNYGKAFADVQPQNTFQGNKLTDWRLSLAYKKQLSWLNERLSVVTGYRTDDYDNFVWNAGRVNGTNINGTVATNVLRVRQYWNGPRNPATFDQLSSNGMEIRYVESTVQDEDQSLQYNQIASHSSLFDERLSLLLGYRYDQHDRRQQRRVAANPDGTSILGATGGPGTWDVGSTGVGTSSAGLVYFPVAWLGAYANYSESFNAPGSGASKIDGTLVGPATADGIDVGLKMEFFKGKLAGTIGYYKMKQTERARTGDRMVDINEIWNDLGRPEDVILAYRDLETYKGDGFEIDLTANLTPNWRMMFNYAVPKTQQADIGPGLRGYYAKNLAAWRAGANNPALPNAARIAQNILDIENTIEGYTQGRTLNNTVEYTSNLYTTYSFRAGRMKGLGVGGGANFRGKNVIGNVNGKPFDYLYANSYFLVSAHTSYDCKVGKFRVRFQLNVSNLLDEEDVVYTAYSVYSGQDVPNTFRYQTPRKYTFTTTFKF